LFWPEEFCLYLQRLVENGYRTNIPIVDEILDNESTGNKRDHLFDIAIKRLKRISSKERQKIIKSLKEITSVESVDRLMLDWDEARKMIKNQLVHFGSHTVNHEILDQVSIGKAENEIVNAGQEIHRQLGIEVDLFAYPNGNFNREVKDILLRSGYRAAVTTKKRLIVDEDSLMEIPRIGMHEDVSHTDSLFIARILTNWF
jgi:peptidoglycan/xylan/chitin deacetylase (PgdA/CDA1 family)